MKENQEDFNENEEKQEIEEKEKIETREKRKNEILGILLMALAVLSAIAIFTPTAGPVVEILSDSYFKLTGFGTYLIPLLFILWGLTLIRLKGLAFSMRLTGFLLTYITVMALINTYLFPEFPLDNALLGKGGGLIGGSISWLLLKLFGYIGSYVILGAFLLIGLLLWFDILLLSILHNIRDFFKNIINRFKSEEKEDDDYLDEDSVDDEYDVDFDEGYDENYDENLFDKFLTEEVAAVEATQEEKEEKRKIEENQDDIKLKTSNEEHNYRLPGTNLLKDSGKRKKKPGNKSELLEETLNSFGVEAKVVKVNHGPTITRYEVQPATGVKVSKIVNLADDIALALAAPDVRIEAPIPGKAAVGIEVPHLKNILVRLHDIVVTRDFKKSRSKLSLALGMGIDGKPMITDLTQMPHLLVAGATGSGKSVCINTIIASILYKATPDEVKLLLIDPKKVELSTYQGLPHLFAPVVTDPKKASNVLKLVVEEMESRYELFSDSGTRGISSYNKSVSSEERLPYIVVIVDELSDLMMVAASEVEDNICRLAQMARAAGIHLVIATQRPSVDVITGLIKANIPSRISFAVSSQTDSRTILDMGGAEKLLGKGDMLLAPTGTQKPQRVQGAFIDNDEINLLVDFVKNQANPEYKVDLDDIKEVELELNDEKDELYEEAVKLVVQYRASISMLQRRLHIGHSRAARLIDMMEEDGIVGPYAGSKPREVLIGEEELANFFNDNDEDEEEIE